MTNPASPGGQPLPPPAQPAVPDRWGTLLPALSALLLVVAGGLTIGGSFGKLEAEFERAGDETLTLTYTSWHLTQGGTYSGTIYFHAPHFGIPMVITGMFTIVSGLLLVFGRGRAGALARPAALASAGLLVGTVWTIGLVVSADLDAVAKSQNFEVTWTTGIGFWLVATGGIAGTLGGLALLFGHVRTTPPEPATPRYGFPVPGPGFSSPGSADANPPFIPQEPDANPPFIPQDPDANPSFIAQEPDANPPFIAQEPDANPPFIAQQPDTDPPFIAQQPDANPPFVPQQPDTNHPFVPQQPQRVDPLSGHPVGDHPAGPAVLPVFQPPTPPPAPPATPPDPT